MILYRTYFIFIFLIAFLFFPLFSSHRAHFNGDYVAFAKEKSFYTDNTEYFIQMLSFNRTRKTDQNDYFLFRPLYHGLNAVYDFYLAEKPGLQVNIALMIHFLSSVLLFFLLTKSTSIFFAAIGTLLYLFQIATTDMLYNIHFHPYLLVNFFILIALNLTQPFLVGFFLFLAGLTHEAIFLGLFIYGFLLWRKREQAKNTYLIPGAIFLALNLFSFFYYKTPSIFGKGDKSNFIDFIGNFILSPIYLVGMESSSLILSVLRTFPNTLSYFIFLPIGTFLLLCIPQIKRKLKLTPLLTLSLCLLTAFIASIALGRGGLRGLNYLRWAIWDDYLTSPYWIILSTVLLSSYINLKKLKPIFKFLILIWLTQNIFFSWKKQQEYPAPSIAVVEQVLNYFKDGRNCFLKNYNFHTDVHLPPELFEKYRCDKKHGNETIVQLWDFNTLKLYPVHK